MLLTASLGLGVACRLESSGDDEDDGDAVEEGRCFMLNLY